MTHFVRTSLFALATVVSLVTAGAVTPAAAHDHWGGGREWHHRDRGWDDRYYAPRHRSWYGYGYGHRYGYGYGYGWGRGDWGSRCWTERRRVRVDTPWGTRLRSVVRRVCN